MSVSTARAQTSTCGCFLRSARLTLALLRHHQLAKFVWRWNIQTNRRSKTLMSFATISSHTPPPLMPNQGNRERIKVYTRVGNITSSVGHSLFLGGSVRPISCIIVREEEDIGNIGSKGLFQSGRGFYLNPQNVFRMFLENENMKPTTQLRRGSKVNQQLE